MRTRDLAVEMALTMFRKVPYIWGGNDPWDEKRPGLDCSGFVLFLLHRLGKVRWRTDVTAQGLYVMLQGTSRAESEAGCLLFYGGDKNSITHVMLGINEDACIGMVKGNSNTLTPEIARERKASCDVRPIKYRSDLVAILDPFWLSDPSERRR